MLCTCFKFYFRSSASISTVKRKNIYWSVPFANYKINAEIKKEIKKLGETFYPQLNIKLVFTNKLTINSFFKFKDKIPYFMNSNVVYT